VTSTSRFGQPALSFDSTCNHSSHNITDEDAGLPLYSSPSTGVRLSDSQLTHMNKLHRREYIEITKRHVIPKVISLATRLVPSVREEVDRIETQLNPGDRKTLSRNSPQQSSLKSTGLDEEDGMESALPSGGGMDENDDCVYLPRSAAMAATRQGSFRLEGGAQSGFVSVEAIAASLDTEAMLMDMEAEALLESIRNDSTSPSTSGRKRSIQKSDGDADDNQSVASISTVDDDDIGGEIRRLGQSMRSLRLDLASADWESMRRDIARTNSFDSFSPLEHNSPNGQARRRWFSKLFASGATSNLKTMKQVGPDNETGGGNASLYWSIALAWSVTILLAGHVKFGDGESWPELFEWPVFKSL